MKTYCLKIEQVCNTKIFVDYLIERFDGVDATLRVNRETGSLQIGELADPLMGDLMALVAQRLNRAWQKGKLPLKLFLVA
tara:strand:+ start:118 stop:357 length:240 start_codon:yes stop_codon:yes gene_type:complete